MALGELQPGHGVVPIVTDVMRVLRSRGVCLAFGLVDVVQTGAGGFKAPSYAVRLETGSRRSREHVTG